MVYTFDQYVHTADDSASTGKKCRVTADTPTEATHMLLAQCRLQYPEAYCCDEEYYMVFPDGRNGCLVWIWDESMKKRFPEA
jgi:hypothetical protein